MRSTNGTHFNIITDCQGALMAIKNSHLNHRNQDVHYTVDLLSSDRQKRKGISFIWVKSHSGILSGNDKVDQLAKQGLCLDINHHIKLPANDLYNACKFSIDDEWANERQILNRSKGGHYASVQFDLPTKPWFHDFYEDRKIITIIW